MAGVIDIHTHALPDNIAKIDIPALEREGNIKAYLNGTVNGLLESMDRCGVEQSVLCSIVTRPEQFAPILAWAEEIRSERIIPFISIHPEKPALLGWSMNKCISRRRAMDALIMAIWRRKPARGLIFHSDRGSRYCCHDSQNLLKKHGIRAA